MKNVLLIGPYIGDWKNEILTFRPYARWIYDQLDEPECFISSHFNRQFLYDWIPEDNFIPIFEHLTRNESDQKNYIHNNVDIRDHKLLVKEFKQKIVKDKGISTRDITIYNVSYTASTPHYSWYQKVFTKINLKPFYNDYIIYIPDKSISVDNNNFIVDTLSKEYDSIIMVGDNSCYDIEKCINFQIDYTESGYKNLMRYLLGCKFVITPCSHWTFLCNLHHIPVVSWGSGANIYKSDNDFGFDNPKSYILIDDNPCRVINAVRYFNRKINGEV